MDEKKKNVPLIVALTIPLMMVVIIAVSIYLPSLFVKPTTNFIYSLGGDYYSQHRYAVKEGRVAQIDVKYPENNYSPTNYKDPRIYYHDIVSNTTREISLEEAQSFLLDDRNVSIDGFQIVSGSHGGDIFFYDYSSRYKRYIKKGSFSKKLNLDNDETYYFQFLGWEVTK